MPNIVFKLGSLDLSNFIRVSPDQKLDLGAGDMLEPAFSDSPLFEGQVLTSIHAKNKELMVPLFLHPPTAPYTQDALNDLIVQVNQALRPIIDTATTTYAEWRNAQATFSTFFTVQFGRFEPDFNFRITEKGWLAGMLHLWVLPYAHTATERIVATLKQQAANAAGDLFVGQANFTNFGVGTPIDGDVPPQLDIRLTCGSTIGDDGKLAIFSTLPDSAWIPKWLPTAAATANFFGFSASALLLGASGAYATSFVALDAAGATVGAVGGASPGPGFWSIALPNATGVYAGDSRILGFVRARAEPFCIRAFDPTGNPIGPTVIASALDGWQLVDYGVLRVPAWMPTANIGFVAGNGPAFNASGMFAPKRAAPAWTKEIGPVFVLPNDSTVMSLDFNSPPLVIDGFDGPASTALGFDQLGNAWQQTPFGPGAAIFTNGNSQAYCVVGSNALYGIGPVTAIVDQECELLVTISTSACQEVFLINQRNAGIRIRPNQGFFTVSDGKNPTPASAAITMVPGQYHMKLVQKGNTVYGNLGAPSGAFAGSASGALASLGQGSGLATSFGPMAVQLTNSGSMITFLEAIRARALASTGQLPHDIIHINQPLAQHSRQNPSGIEVIDLQARQRGPLQALELPMPTLGAGMFCIQHPFDYGPANDSSVNVVVRARERFTYAR